MRKEIRSFGDSEREMVARRPWMEVIIARA
jgi:hypothetical protein